MYIITDTREKEKHNSVLRFNHPWTKRWRIALEYGDYACMYNDGYAPPFIFERKTIQDLFQSLSRNYSRFKKEIIKAQTDGVMLIIIIEGTLTEIFKGYKYTQIDGASKVKQLFTLMTRHHVPFVCCSSRAEMVKYITYFFLSLGYERLRKGKEEKREKSSGQRS